MIANRLSAEDVAAVLRHAGLRPADWDLTEIVRRTNRWISDYRAELTDPDVATWSIAWQIEQYAEFGRLNTVDWIEQCVIEAGPSTAPWERLAERVQADEFADWPPIWQADVPDHLRVETVLAEAAVEA